MCVIPIASASAWPKAIGAGCLRMPAFPVAQGWSVLAVTRTAQPAHQQKVNAAVVRFVETRGELAGELRAVFMIPVPTANVTNGVVGPTPLALQRVVPMTTGGAIRPIRITADVAPASVAFTRTKLFLGKGHAAENVALWTVARTLAAARILAVVTLRFAACAMVVLRRIRAACAAVMAVAVAGQVLMAVLVLVPVIPTAQYLYAARNPGIAVVGAVAGDVSVFID